jgi:hypothetical protein
VEPTQADPGTSTFNRKDEAMVYHSSATAREPHVNRTTRTSTIINALTQRAQSVLNDKSIDARSRAIIRYALETNDPWLAKLVSHAGAGESIADTLDFSDTHETNEANSSVEKIEALAEIICGAGNESAAALFVLMGTLCNSAHPAVLANTAKHFTFTRCGELNVYGMVDAQIAVLEDELLAGASVS